MSETYKTLKEYAETEYIIKNVFFNVETLKDFTKVFKENGLIPVYA